MKRTLSILLAAMLFCFAAIPALAEDDVVELNVFYATSRPMNDATELTRQYIRDNLGVDINLTQGDSSNFAQQLALYISSGDMPDVVWLSYPAWKEYQDEGAWADISGYIDQYPGLDEYVGENWAYMTDDGGVYGVPSMLSVPSSHVPFIRQDWLDKLGLDKPETLDEMTEVLRAFTHDDPDGDGENNTYGLSGAGYSFLSFLFGAFGSSSVEANFLNEDGTVTTNAISAGYKDALAYLRDIYAEGLIDPEMFTATYEQCQAKWGRGEMGLWSAWFSHGSNAYSRFDFGELQPDAVVDVVMPPVGPDGLSGNLYAAPFDSVVGVSYLCSEEKIEAAVKLLDFEASPLGFRTVHYGVVDDFFEWDEEQNLTTWYWGINDNLSRSGHEVTDMEVYKMLYRENWQIQSNMLVDDVINRIRILGSDMRFNEPTRENIFAMMVTPEYLENKAELETYFITNMIAFIMGEKSLDTDWDAYVEEYLSMGGEVARQAQLAAYNETMGTSYTFAE